MNVVCNDVRISTFRLARCSLFYGDHRCAFCCAVCSAPCTVVCGGFCLAVLEESSFADFLLILCTFFTMPKSRKRLQNNDVIGVLKKVFHWHLSRHFIY